ncbi:hypothetical protein RchiOBHm_Chr2g0133741 [Rosa chinensis]|uniref:Uncharacterized protein n=1 Tax=Rosa chinensis TaxID=74649 RepID=A0A2P6RVP3_ROSCH|nr:uncharacterized protein LOC112185997 isoform X3 [Rosa chinensis]PRQ50488.1 hypothetical protein RchiOBHm_Chr2g0133741 [Rosa chinensis]
MSFRNMLKVSFLMLLAMALAATNTHARLDLFGHQLLTSKSQPDPNYEEAEMFKSATTKEAEKLMKAAAVVQEEKPSSSKVKADTIPYSECQENCNYTCVCTLIWPPELSQCICAGSSKLSTTNAAENLLKPAAVVQEEKPSSSIVKADTIPYSECQESCEYTCVCTLIWPPELSQCICAGSSKLSTTKAAENLLKPAAVVQEEKPSSSKVKADTIPYSECQETCNYTCACTLIWPPELSQCICVGSSKLSTTKAAENLLKPVAVVQEEKPSSSKVKADTIPYSECQENCNYTCVCTLIWPPELSQCICAGSSKLSTTKAAKNLLKPAAVVQEEKPSSSKVKADTIPYSECQETCNYTCACTLIWPPELSQCICVGSSKLSTTKAAEKLHKELDLVSKPVAKLEGSFLPYPECIEKCDECVICTRVYPIEAAYCYCGMNPSIQKSGIALPI